MRLASQFSMCLALAGVLLSFSPAGFSGTDNSHSRYAGTYESAVPDSDKAGAVMSVSLGRDGTATIMQDYGKRINTSFGHWNDSGGQITVTFDAIAGKPAVAPMVFQAGHDGLKAVTWDHAAWGKESPPPMKKQNPNWHSHRRW